MTTLTIEWETTVIEKHRIVIDPETDGVPEGFATLEEMYRAALVATGTLSVNADTVPEHHLECLRVWLSQREILTTGLHSTAVEEITDRTVTTTKITQPAKDAA